MNLLPRVQGVALRALGDRGCFSVRARGACGTLLLACACGSPELAPAWQVAVEDHDGGLLLSVLAESEDVWAVGGRADKSLILTGGPAGLTELESPGTALAWWVCSAGSARIVVGEQGMVLRYADGEFERMDLGIDSTLYGCWGTSSDDFWVAGGDPFAGPAQLVHVVDGVGEAPSLGPLVTQLPKVFFKVVGAAGWLYACTDDGAVFSRSPDGEWARQEVAASEPLFTVSATDESNVWVVGGDTRGVAASFDGTRWTDRSPPGAAGLFGVWTGPSSTWAVGMAGQIYQLVDGSLTSVESPTSETLHSVAGGVDGDVWAAGGNVLEPNDSALRGVVLHR